MAVDSDQFSDRIADLHRLSHRFCYINYFLHGNRSAILSIWVLRGMAFTILLGFEIDKNQSVAIRVYGGIFSHGVYGKIRISIIGL